MPTIQLLDQNTIYQIAAGEVIEKPASIVKELCENSIDSGASAITIEIKEGGKSYIRVTDNGCGIAYDEIPLAFLRHATSKIANAMDLLTVKSLGFRGEALSSIAAVAQVELITKPASATLGGSYRIEGGLERAYEAVGAPDGTTIIVRNLFFNTPARKEFLKTTSTEASYIANVVEKLALSHPSISFRLIIDSKSKIFTTGKSNLKDLIYIVYGRNMANELINIDFKSDFFEVKGYLGNPSIARANKSFETYFVNGRYIRSKLIEKAIEQAYKPFLMQHRFPFVMLYFDIPQQFIDVNVHPTKMEIRFQNEDVLFHQLLSVVSECLSKKEHIPTVKEEKPIVSQEPIVLEKTFEPFEQKRMVDYTNFNTGYTYQNTEFAAREDTLPYEENKKAISVQGNIFDENKLLTPTARIQHKLIGQLFDTYCLIEYDNHLFICDQHAAHEKVLYERFLSAFKQKTMETQLLITPLIITLTLSEFNVFHKHKAVFTAFGFEIEEYGDRDVAIRGIPMALPSLKKKELFIELLDDLGESNLANTSEMIEAKFASIACKAAVKGHDSLSMMELNKLIDELLLCENPYSCPHGRPTIIKMSRYELEKKFKRVL